MSETFYHVDRWDDLAPGDTLGLEHPEEWGPEVNSLLTELYPDGLSHHGRYYCTQNLHEEGSDDLWDFSCEAVFELVRARRYPERPSRLESVFGFETLDAVETFLAEFVDSSHAVWKVETARGFAADMNLVDAPDYARGLHRAEYYWRGETFLDDPLWEVLLEPPVEVVERVDV